MVQDRKDRIIKDNETRKLNEHLSQIAKEELIYDKIVSSIIQIRPITTSDITVPNIIKKHSASPQESFLLISDAHVGLAVIPSEVGGLGNYNVDIFKKRLNNLTETVCHITDLHRTTHQLDTLNIGFLGDIVHGGNDAGQWGFLHSEQNVMDQIFDSIREFAVSILTLKKIYKNINVYCVYGNHGRVARRGVEKKFVNWDYLIYKWLEASLSLQRDIRFHIPRANFHIAESMGKKILLVHGDQARGWNGIPWYGLNRLESKYRSIIDRTKTIDGLWDAMDKAGIDFNTPTEEQIKFAFNYVRSFDYMACGHFHSMGEIETNSGGRIILNSSFIGGDDYSIGDLVCASTPSQKFFGINKDRKTWNYDIELDRD